MYRHVDWLARARVAGGGRDPRERPGGHRAHRRPPLRPGRLDRNKQKEKTQSLLAIFLFVN